jgi:hypothetical protein
MSANEASITEMLDSLADDGLDRVIEAAKNLKTVRKNKRQNEALLLIRRALKDNDLNFNLVRRAGKRGRPRKTAA